MRIMPFCVSNGTSSTASLSGGVAVPGAPVAPAEVVGVGVGVDVGVALAVGVERGRSGAEVDPVWACAQAPSMAVSVTIAVVTSTRLGEGRTAGFLSREAHPRTL
ncbi:hypothetical protein [Agrococcus sp. UYP10]|uniref:hypothetical protein n=1 Tax=Agrococcus sp. UYP10 TaxID=1756355 RepID=UPI0033994CF2